MTDTLGGGKEGYLRVTEAQSVLYSPLLFIYMRCIVSLALVCDIGKQ